MKQVIFLHGFASSVNGRKAQFLRARFDGRSDAAFYAFPFSPTLADFEYLTITGMIARLRQYVLDRGYTAVSLIGSSMGGLVALNYAARFGGVERLLLLAPALTYLSGERVGMPMAEWRERGYGEIFHFGFNRMVKLRYDLEVDGRFYQTAPPPPAPITIIHGAQDEVVPVADSRRYAARWREQAALVELDAGHDINAHLELIWDVTEQFLLEEPLS
ncbi:MAG TPA: alpha/beta fold hydrolase [Anaerolineae bacterium]|nr:alpha/beta fold hydrolase [Anaerolineae bacterium]